MPDYEQGSTARLSWSVASLPHAQMEASAPGTAPMRGVIPHPLPAVWTVFLSGSFDGLYHDRRRDS
jgi:hypothetical protein